jgi:hypothetical protein
MKRQWEETVSALSTHAFELAAGTPNGCAWALAESRPRRQLSKVFPVSLARRIDSSLTEW